MTNEQVYRDMLERLVKAYDSGVVMSSDKTGYWNVLQEAKALLQRADEPRADDPLVQCRCGWLGKTSELRPNPGSQGKLCGKCDHSFWPATL